jgi:hypothetical protein
MSMNEIQHPETIEEEFSPDELAEQYSQEIAGYFGIEKIEGIKVSVFDSVEDIWAKHKEYTGKVAEKYVRNFSPQTKAWGTICLLREGARDGLDRVVTKADFKASLKHELVHTYQKAFYQKNKIDPSQVPSWLREGESLYLAEQKTNDPGIITVDRLRKMASGDGDKYSIGLKIVTEIMEKYDKEKLFEIIAMNEDDRNRELQRMFEWIT